MAVLDTNVLIRLITQDHDDHSRRAYELFERIEQRNQAIFLPEGILVEVVQVLSSKRLYNRERSTIRDRLEPIIRMSQIEMDNKRTILRALNLYAEVTRLSFPDALCVMHAQRFEDRAVISFDRGFRNLSEAAWMQP